MGKDVLFQTGQFGLDSCYLTLGFGEYFEVAHNCQIMIIKCMLNL